MAEKEKLEEKEPNLIDLEYGDSNALVNTDHDSEGQPRMKPYENFGEQ